MSPTHYEAGKTTAAVRDQLKDRGLLGNDARTFSTLRQRHWTLGEKRDPAQYQSGDVLVFHQNAQGFKKSSRLAVTKNTDSLPLSEAERFGVFRQGQIEIATGDRIRITAGGKTKDRKHALHNGDLFTVNGFSKNGDLIVGNGWTIDKDFGHIAHGHVVTSHAAQGKSVDYAFVAQSSASFPASSMKQLYVTLSRAKELVLLFTDSKEELLAHVSTGRDQMSGHELVQHAARIQRDLDRDDRVSAHTIDHAMKPQPERELAIHDR